MDVKMLEQAKTTYNACVKEIVLSDFKELEKELDGANVGQDDTISLRRLAIKRFHEASLKKQPYPLRQWSVIVTKVERCFAEKFLTTLPTTTQTELQTHIMSGVEKDLNYMIGKITENYPLGFVPRSAYESWVALFSQLYAQQRKIFELDIMRGRVRRNRLPYSNEDVWLSTNRQDRLNQLDTALRNLLIYAERIVWFEVQDAGEKKMIDQKQITDIDQIWKSCCVDVFSDFVGRKLSTEYLESFVFPNEYPSIRLHELLWMTPDRYNLPSTSLIVIVSMIERRFIDEILVKLPLNVQTRIDDEARKEVFKYLEIAVQQYNIQMRRGNQPQILLTQALVTTQPLLSPTTTTAPAAASPNPSLQLSMYGKPVVPLQFIEAEPIDPFVTQQRYLDWWGRRLARGIAETKQFIHNAALPQPPPTVLLLPPAPPAPNPANPTNAANTPTPMQFGGGARFGGRFTPKIFFHKRLV
jgi:hypothetical protein